ncbi:MAG: HEPN domain-containing protein [Candidatus Muirbacterium halophilum]|nr:HEPN domain-containing protein [Candidatus Muirbacterium halophilum]MCK9475880.1 HEPN domain-containing protein [Candidatus Muirbacterium halophilum]
MSEKVNKYIDYWISVAKHDLDVAIVLFESKKYDSCLFFGHLSIEKILKGLWVKNNNMDFPPKTHNLLKLANETKIDFSKEDKKFFEILNEFNIEARYPDYKLTFYKICTEEFTKEKFDKIKELFKCILEKL